MEYLELNCLQVMPPYFANKGPSGQSYGFPSGHVWMWELDIKKAEHQRIDAFEMWCWRRLLRVPWSARRSNQSILKEMSPEYSLEGLMLKLKLQYFGHLMRRADSLKKTPMLGKIDGRRRRGWQRMRWLDGLTDSMGISLSKVRELGQGGLACYSPWGCKESDTTERLHSPASGNSDRLSFSGLQNHCRWWLQPCN